VKGEILVEELFVLTGPNYDQLLTDVGLKLHVMHKIGRVVIVKGDPEEIEHFAAQEGVVTGSDLIRQGKEMPTGTWTYGEKIFVAGWKQRQSDAFKNKIRPGDGLPWDAPGFKPPGGMGGP
jgi:hypothetical protein